MWFEETLAWHSQKVNQYEILARPDANGPHRVIGGPSEYPLTQRVAFAPTDCNPFDFSIPEQWVFGHTL